MQPRMSLRICVFVALIASASLGFELLQTRVLSALYFNNVVYMTVTIALLGFGMSGVMASVLQRRVANTDRVAVLCAAGLGLSIPLCILLASALPGFFPKIPALYKMIVSYFILVIPFVFAGGALSLVFMGHGKRIFVLYFADLGARRGGCDPLQSAPVAAGRCELCLAVRRGGVCGICDFGALGRLAPQFPGPRSGFCGRVVLFYGPRHRERPSRVVQGHGALLRSAIRRHAGRLGMDDDCED